MRTLSCMLLAAAALLPAACASQPQAAPDHPVIVSIVTRQHTITIRHSPAGPVYTIQAADGTTLARDQTLESLQASHADLYRLIYNTYAPDPRLSAGAPDLYLR